jgi:uncharacterized SAM-binding protein YcdF (DUF218 family)
MPPVLSQKPARRWTFVLLCAVLLIVGVTAAVPATRHALLRSAGHALVAEDVPAKADIVIVSSDALGAGILEAAELIRGGFSSRVGISARPPGLLQQELMRRGLPYIDLQAFSIQLLQALGVTDIAVIPEVVGTNDEGRVLRQWCAANSIHSLLFVSVADHSRRTRRVLDRALGQHGVRVMVRYAKLSQFDPDAWWQTRNGQRIEIIESEKLLVDFLRHPF